MKVRVYFLFIRKVSLFVYIKEDLFRLFNRLGSKQFSEDSAQGFGILNVTGLLVCQSESFWKP